MTFDPIHIVRTLAAHQVRFAVVGGFALAAHGVVRATEDLDLVVERGLVNATRLVEALRDLGSTWHEPLSPEVLVRPIDARISSSAGQIHLLRQVAGVPSYEALEREWIAVDDVEFEVATNSALRAMKLAAGRPKDLIDVDELDEIAKRARPES